MCFVLKQHFCCSAFGKRLLRLSTEWREETGAANESATTFNRAINGSVQLLPSNLFPILNIIYESRGKGIFIIEIKRRINKTIQSYKYFKNSSQFLIMWTFVEGYVYGPL
jgi:hypothetical protein